MAVSNAVTFTAIVAARTVSMPALTMLAPKAKTALAVRFTENDRYSLHSNLSFYLPCHLCHLKRIKNVHARESPGNANYVAYVANHLFLLDIFCQVIYSKTPLSCRDEKAATRESHACCAVDFRGGHASLELA